MTTTVSLLSRDCIVIGCDSLATTTFPFVNPFKLFKFFDFENSFELKCDNEGIPLLKNFTDIYALREDIPFNQVPNVTKIFSIEPAIGGLLFAGISTIGDKSIKNLIDEFTDLQLTYLKGNYTIKGIATRLLEFLVALYNKEFKESHHKPDMEIILSGYSKRYRQPEAYKISLGDKCEVKEEVERGDYNIVFGGQYDVIERVVKGIDMSNVVRVLLRVEKIKRDYHTLLVNHFKERNIEIEIPEPKEFGDNLNFLADDFNFEGILTHIPNFSEQAAIDFVDFLVEVMIKAQHFSNRLPTVGGDVHVAIITKKGGFKWISKEEYRYKNYGVPKHD